MELNSKPHTHLSQFFPFLETLICLTFQRLWINYSNERLHRLFLEILIGSEEGIYNEEGVEWEGLNVPFNDDCIDAIDRRGSASIFSLLDEELILPSPSDMNFLQKLRHANSHHPYLDFNPTLPQHFLIRHYAGPVSYDVRNFTSTNADYVIVSTNDLLPTSSNPILPLLVPPAPTATQPRSAYRLNSVSSQLKESLNGLLTTLIATTPHFIRCIRPNQSSTSGLFVDNDVINQLTTGGIFHAIKISSLGYPTKFTYARFANR
jgi:myosin-5